MHHRDFPLVDAVMDSRGCAFHLLLSPCQPGLVSNGKSHLVMDPSDMARRVVESNLRVVWRGSQWVNLSVCMYACMYVIVKCGGIVGGGGIIKQFLLKFLFAVS
jgi:hypothetical protein